MTGPLIIDGMTYISIRDAAVCSHLSTEYLARLARSGRLQARMVGRMWFIENRSLQQFLSARIDDSMNFEASSQLAKHAETWEWKEVAAVR